MKIRAYQNEDSEIRIKSSSGALFSSLANIILDRGGVVFGAKFNKEWGVEHDYIENKENLKFLRKSKYVYSNIKKAVKDVDYFLRKDRYVLFTGTPCQVAALKFFLKKDYENLLTAEVVCHGAPQRRVWEVYLSELLHKLGIMELSHIRRAAS